LFYITCMRKCKRKWHLHKNCTIFVWRQAYSKPNYVMMILGDYFAMKAKKSGGTKNKLYCERNQGWQVSDFPSYLRCSNNIFTFLLQISWSKQLLTFVLNVKRCLHQERSIIICIFVNYWYLHLLKLWRWYYSSTKNLKRQQQQDENPCFMYTIIFLHEMIDDTFGRNTCLALCQHVNFKGL